MFHKSRNGVIIVSKVILNSTRRCINVAWYKTEISKWSSLCYTWKEATEREQNNWHGSSWRNAVNPIVEFPNLEESGWHINGDTQWVDGVVLPTVEQLLSDEISENESDSDDEEIENIEDEGIYGSDIDSDYKTFD